MKKCVIRILTINYHLGRFGRGGNGGSFIVGTVLFKAPNKGLGGGIKLGVIPPLANGISGGTKLFFSFSYKGGGGICIVNVGIFPKALGLFSASNLSAKPPCFSPLFVSFFTAY